MQREEEGARLAREQHQESALHAAELEQVRIVREAEVARVRAAEQVAAQRLATEAAIGVRELERAAENRQADVELRLAEARARIANDTSTGALQARLIDALPAIAEAQPKPQELRAISIGGGQGGGEIASLVAQVAAILDGFRAPAPTKRD